MNRHISVGLLFTLLVVPILFAQEETVIPEESKVTEEAQETQEVKEPLDTSTIEGILTSVYEVISGEAGVSRDWEAFSSLFHPDARLIPVGPTPEGGWAARARTPGQYSERAAPFFEKQGFFESEIASKVDRFGNIAQVFSTYEAKKSLEDAEPFMRGINSFQLMHDGERWWVMTIYWQSESEEVPIPEQYLPKEAESTVE